MIALAVMTVIKKFMVAAAISLHCSVTIKYLTICFETELNILNLSGIV